MYFLFSSIKKQLKEMNHFLFTQVCKNCKKSYKTFKIFLSYYDDNGCCSNLSKEEMDAFSFICSKCNSMNSVDFQQICNQNTIWYLRNIEINERIQNEINNLLRIKIEKLNLQENL